MSLETASLIPVDSRSPSESFIGVAAATDVAKTDIFLMLHAALRELDERAGQGFLKRYLKRPGEQWARWQQKIWKLPRITDFEATPAELLEHLRAHVAFGAGSGTPDAVAKELNEAGLRRLIKLAVPFWQRRGRRLALEDSLRTVSGLRPMVIDWFFIRNILDEIQLGVEGDNHDLWSTFASVFDATTGVVDGEMQVMIRVADLDGTLKRTLVQNLVTLARPISERYEVAYPEWLDTFLDGRMGHWITTAGTPAEWKIGIERGEPDVDLFPGFEYAAGTFERVQTPLSAAWTNYSWSFILLQYLNNGTGEFRFYVQSDPTKHYALVLTPPSTAKLVKRNPGETVLSTVTIDLTANVQRGTRIEVQAPDAVSVNQIRIYVDGNLVIEHLTDSTFHSGTIEIGMPVGATDKNRFMWSELFEIPLVIVQLTP